MKSDAIFVLKCVLTGVGLMGIVLTLLSIAYIVEGF